LFVLFAHVQKLTYLHAFERERKIVVDKEKLINIRLLARPHPAYFKLAQEINTLPGGAAQWSACLPLEKNIVRSNPCLGVRLFDYMHALQRCRLFCFKLFNLTISIFMSICIYMYVHF
jgi:hypothetical protein